jgi:hypothetical protein
VRDLIHFPLTEVQIIGLMSTALGGKLLMHQVLEI